MSPILFFLDHNVLHGSKRGIFTLQPRTPDGRQLNVTLRTVRSLSYPASLSESLLQLLEDELVLRTQEGLKRTIEQEKMISSFRLRPSSMLDRLQHVLQSSKLFFRNKPVFFDSLTVVTLALTVIEEGKEYRIDTKAIAKTLTFSLPEQGELLLGPPHHLYTQCFLRPLQ